MGAHARAAHQSEPLPRPPLLCIPCARPQLQKQAELTAEENAAWRHREQRRMEKYAAIDYERQQQAEHRAELATQVCVKKAQGERCGIGKHKERRVDTKVYVNGPEAVVEL